MTFTIVAANSDNELSNVISEYVVNEQHATDKWSTMVNLAYDANVDADGWKRYYESAEEDQASRRADAGEVIARTKAGKVIASKAFPKTWNTDKAIIGKALAEGVDLVDADGNPKGKTALQQEYREKAADGKEDKPAREKLTTIVNAYNSVFAELERDDMEFFADQMRKFYAGFSV